MPRLGSAKVILYLFFITVMDTTVLPMVQIHSIVPSFLCLFVCYVAFEGGPPKTLYAAFWVGLIRDFLGVGPLGLEACIFVGLAFLLDFVVQKMERQFPGIYFLITFAFVFLVGALRLLLGYYEQLFMHMAGDYLAAVALTALYTSVLLPFFYFLTDRWLGHVGAKQYELFQ